LASQNPYWIPASLVAGRKWLALGRGTDDFPKLREQLWAGEFWSDGNFFSDTLAK